jgi:hypothetical protein
MHDSVSVRIGEGSRDVAQEIHGVADRHDGLAREPVAE